MSGQTTESAERASAWEELTAEAQRDRRREPRLKLPYPIEVYGFDRAGHYFSERTVTLNVSPGGCMLDIKHHPEEQGVLAIRRTARDGTRMPEHKPMLFLVCWTQRLGRRWAVGASKLQSGDFWGLSVSQENIGN
ncbi:MAG TPA: PilZ domain-containing protein [Candidatus Acidoferrales bacterium]|nr:PilZ domain-containing protein [Candidatus Acidoferrales bacterium]